MKYGRKIITMHIENRRTIKPIIVTSKQIVSIIESQTTIIQTICGTAGFSKILSVANKSKKRGSVVA